MILWTVHSLKTHLRLTIWITLFSLGLFVSLDLSNQWGRYPELSLLELIAIRSIPFLLYASPILFFLGTALAHRTLTRKMELPLAQSVSINKHTLCHGFKFSILFLLLLWTLSREWLWPCVLADLTCTNLSNQNTQRLCIQLGEAELLIQNPQLDAGRLEEVTLIEPAKLTALAPLVWTDNRWSSTSDNSDSPSWLSNLPSPLDLKIASGQMKSLTLASLLPYTNSHPQVLGELAKRIFLPLLYLWFQFRLISILMTSAPPAPTRLCLRYLVYFLSLTLVVELICP